MAAHYDDTAAIRASTVLRQLSRLGWTHQAVADALGLTRSCVSRWARRDSAPRPPAQAALDRLLREVEAARAAALPEDVAAFMPVPVPDVAVWA